jgi:hypothetical protein
VGDGGVVAARVGVGSGRAEISTVSTGQEVDLDGWLDPLQPCRKTPKKVAQGLETGF